VEPKYCVYKKQIVAFTLPGPPCATVIISFFITVAMMMERFGERFGWGGVNAIEFAPRSLFCWPFREGENGKRKGKVVRVLIVYYSLESGQGFDCYYSWPATGNSNRFMYKALRRASERVVSFRNVWKPSRLGPHSASRAA
jgi:hypothetical protein